MLWYTLTTLLQSQLLWIWRFESITAYLKDARNNDYIHQRHSSSYSPATPITSHFRNQQQQPRFFETRRSATPSQHGSFVDLPSARPTPKSNNHMDIDFVRRGSLSLMEQDHRVKQGLCLVCGKAGHRKANCPKSRFKFNSDSSKNIHAIQTEIHKTARLWETDSISFKETVKFS
ncbi:hypothetical protein BASA83_013538 [Batrachochytrium salamandrivorans]|nr:hypothetical protein BASA83_013538 [Batrachochytrium salamandrivorans]